MATDGKVFRDPVHSSRLWNCEINGGSVRRLGAIGIRIYGGALFEGQPSSMQQLMTDPVVMGKAIWCAVAKQAEGFNVTEEMFEDMLTGDAMAAAFDAFWCAVREFNHATRQAAAVEAIDKQMEFLKEAQRVGVEKIAAVDVAATVAAGMNKE